MIRCVNNIKSGALRKAIDYPMIFCRTLNYIYVYEVSSSRSSLSSSRLPFARNQYDTPDHWGWWFGGLPMHENMPGKPFNSCQQRENPLDTILGEKAGGLSPFYVIITCVRLSCELNHYRCTKWERADFTWRLITPTLLFLTVFSSNHVCKDSADRQLIHFANISTVTWSRLRNNCHFAWDDSWWFVVPTLLFQLISDREHLQ